MRFPSTAQAANAARTTSTLLRWCLRTPCLRTLVAALFVFRTAALQGEAGPHKPLRDGASPSAATVLRSRLTAGRATLDRGTKVRILPPEPLRNSPSGEDTCPTSRSRRVRSSRSALARTCLRLRHDRLVALGSLIRSPRRVRFADDARIFWAWLSWLERSFRVRENAGSNPAAQTLAMLVSLVRTPARHAGPGAFDPRASHDAEQVCADVAQLGRGDTLRTWRVRVRISPSVPVLFGGNHEKEKQEKEEAKVR